jgi:hypothetical protein
VRKQKGQGSGNVGEVRAAFYGAAPVVLTTGSSTFDQKQITWGLDSVVVGVLFDVNILVAWGSEYAETFTER